MIQALNQVGVKSYCILTVQDFDFINWFYWAQWWQQCSYFVPPQMYSQAPQSVGSPVTSVSGFPGSPGNSHTPQPNGLMNPGIGIQIRIINGM